MVPYNMAGILLFFLVALPDFSTFTCINDVSIHDGRSPGEIGRIDDEAHGIVNLTDEVEIGVLQILGE